MGKRIWLYVRLGLLALVVLLVAQMFIANVSREGSARTFFWTDWLGGIWTLIIAFGLGMVALPLARASIRTWKEFQQDKAERRSEQAERQVQSSLADLRMMAQGVQPSQPQPGAKPTGPLPKDEKSSAADIWTDEEKND